MYVVYVVDTTADSYRTQPPRDKHDPDPAGFRYPPRAGTAYGLEHGVALKRRHYLPVLDRGSLYDDKVFVPFVVAARRPNCRVLSGPMVKGAL